MTTNKTKSKLEKASKWLALYAAIVTTCITTFAIYEKVSPKKHEMEIYVADLNNRNEYIEFTIAYYNIGDFSEVLSKVALFLGQETHNDEKLIYWDQADCTKPLLIEAKKTRYGTYKAKIDFKNENLKIFPDQKQQFRIILHFDFLSKEHGKASEWLTVGTLIPYPSETPFVGRASIDFVTTKAKVDFKNARPAIIKSSYPIESKYEPQNFCGDKI